MSGRGAAAPLHVRRAELSLARADRWPLRELQLDPDPLTGFVQAYAALNPALAESAEVCVALLPLRPSQVAQRRKRIERADQRADRPNGGGMLAGVTGGGGAGIWGQVAGAANGSHARGGGQSRVSARPQTTPRRNPYLVGTVGARTMTRDVADSLYSWDPAFAMQVLIRVTSADKSRARSHLSALVAAFGVWSAANSFRQVGLHIGPVMLGGANAPWRRYWFDRRWATGRFSPAKTAVVSTPEIAGFFKPPTAKCPAPNVLRSGGLVPAAPRSLPTYERQPELMPWGWIKTEDGERPVGVPLADTLFALRVGKAGFGKTMAAAVQFVSLARAGHGCMFVDPHADALKLIEPYLVDIAERVVKIDLSPRGRSARQAGWNLFDMAGRTEDDIEGRVSAVVQSFASTLKWGEINNRAITITTMAAQSMCELALVLPPELAPTIFQMSKILSDDEWRAAVVPHLSAPTREFWEDIFERMSDEAITPVTNLITRLRSSATVAAMFGASQSTYDVRKAMDEGKVVLACPGGGEKGPLIANFLVYDVLQALMSRERDRDMAPEDRLPFYLFIDELQTVDGASGGNLASMLEESRKFGGRLLGMVQQPSRLTEKTLEAMLNNLSHLSSTNVSNDQARLVTAEWAGKVDPDTLTQLPKYHFVSSVMLGGQKTLPFKSRGFELGRLWGDVAQPDRVGELNRVIDANMDRRPVGDSLVELDKLNGRIRAHLEHLQPGPPPAPPEPPPRGGGDNPTRETNRRGSGGLTRRLHIVGS